jgi:hypothetical protein
VPKWNQELSDGSEIMNLLQETIEFILQIGKETKDIIFIGSENSGHSCTWAEYEILADQEYDNGFGAQEVARDLIIVFSDGSKMWRNEYDGSEWWAHFPPFKVPTEAKPIKKLFVNGFGWEDLANINH